MRNTLHIGDARDWAATLPPQSVQTIVTSPPYFGLRSYLPTAHPDKAREMGGEATVGGYVAALVALFASLRPALRDDGTLFLNLGDAYSGNNGGPQGATGDRATRTFTADHRVNRATATLGPKQLLGMPWRVAFALQDDGWVLRSDIIWHKSNPMPESVTDRPTRAHEYLFLLSKKPTYFYDATAIAEPISDVSLRRIQQPNFAQQTGGMKDYGATGINPSRSMRKALENFAESASGTRNSRSVWTIPSEPYPAAHFATFPRALIRPCILAGSSEYGACAAMVTKLRPRQDLTPAEQVKVAAFLQRKGLV